MLDNRLQFQQISQLIEDQFPVIYREEGPMLVAFLKAYYEWLETTSRSAYNEGRQLQSISDIDSTLEEYLDHFKSTYLDGFPYTTHVDQRFLIKHIMDFYRTKGTTQSTKLFMKLLFGEEVEIYYPGGDVLKPSDSKWKKPQYLEVSATERTKTYIDRQIFGSISGASAFVDSIVRKRIDGKMIDVIYMSTVRGTFVTGDSITDDGEIRNAPIVVGSLTSFRIQSGGRNNKIGDVFNVIQDGALHGKIRVTGVEDATGRVNFNLLDGGQGYTIDDYTKVYVSDTILDVDNPDLAFLDLEEVHQQIERLTLLSALTLNNTALPGDSIVGVDSSNTVIAQGRVVSITPGSTTPSANATIVVAPTSGTFRDQVKIVANTSATAMKKGETIVEESAAILTYTSNAAAFSVGQKVEQAIYHPVETTLIVGVSTGTIASIAGSELTINSYFGSFQPGTIKVANTFAATISSIVETATPAYGIITNVTGNEISVDEGGGEFSVGKKIRSNRTRVLRTVSSVVSQGASDVRLVKNNATGIIDTSLDQSVKAIVIGQSDVDVGVYGSRNFITSDVYPLYIKTDRSRMLSPPLDANGNIIEVTMRVTGKSNGQSAGFKIANLVNEQTVTINTDMLNGQNIANVNYMEIRLDGMNSGVNRVQSWVVNSGGTQYVNNTIVTLEGGGYGNSEPYLAGYGTIRTNGSGTITSILPTEWGSGYYVTPTPVLPVTTGVEANVSPVLSLSYGFPKSFTGDSTVPMIDLLSYATMTIGSIANINRINPGINYNKDPYVRVINKSIAAYRRGNYDLVLNNVVGAFQVGENIYQQIGPERFYKGVVIDYEGDKLLLHAERTLFETDFNDLSPIIGDVTGSYGLITSSIRIYENIFGDNAEFDATVITANGVMTAVEVIDSGFGYRQNYEAELVSDTNLFTVSGTTRLGKHGIGEGFWETTNSHLNSEKKIHDNDYYQEFSYDVISSITLKRYADILKKVSHVAGTKLFGSVASSATKDITPDPLTDITITNTYDAASTALFARMSVQPNTARKKAINNLVVMLKDYEIWDKFDAFYLMASHDRQAARLNIIGNSYNLTEVNTPTFTVNRGFKGVRSTSSYLETNVNQITFGGKMALKSLSMGLWNLTNTTDNVSYDMGNYRVGIMTRTTTGFTNNKGNNSSILSVPTSKANGHFSVTRNSNTINAYNDGLFVNSSNVLTANDAQTNNTLKICASTGPSSVLTVSEKELAAAYWGEFLDLTEMGVVDMALRAYMIELGLVVVS